MALLCSLEQELIVDKSFLPVEIITKLHFGLACLAHSRHSVDGGHVNGLGGFASFLFPHRLIWDLPLLGS